MLFWTVTPNRMPLAPADARRLSLVLLAALVLGLTACGGGDSSTSPESLAGAETESSRILVLGIDSLDPEVVQTLAAEGQLPNFQKILDDGVLTPLFSPPPLLSPILWTTIATGRKPIDHGIGHFTTVDPSTGAELPVTSSLRRVESLWTLFPRAGKSVGVVGWWATWPAETIEGATIVSDHTGYHFLMADTERVDLGPREIQPPEVAEWVAPLLREPTSVDAEETSLYARVPPEELDLAFDFENDLSHLRWAVATAESYNDIGLEIWRRQEPDLLLVYIEGVDSMSHLFGHLYRRGDLAGELAAQQERFGGTVEAMYRLADRIVGDAIAAMDDRTTLVVVSDHGFQLGELPDDPAKTRDMRRVSDAFHSPYGSLLLYGDRVRPGAVIDEPTVLDVTPTILALAGLPAAEDMPGRVLEEAIEGSAPERIASYERGNGEPGTLGSESQGGQRDDAVDQAVLERLKSLGYIGGGSGAAAKNDRNLATLLLREGEYRAAAKAFKDLSDADPTDPAMRTGLATALGQLGRDEAALAEFGRALDADPLFVPAYLNRGLLLERLGRRDEAVAGYRTALRYDSDYEPARRALDRLGEPSAPVATTVAQEQAQLRLEAARDAARRGDYESADSALDEAEALVPGTAVVLQYRSNIAFLRGHFEEAERALVQALEIEPDNAAMRRNLERLRERLREPQ